MTFCTQARLNDKYRLCENVNVNVDVNVDVNVNENENMDVIALV